MELRAIKITYKGSVSNRSDSKDLITDPGEMVIVKRGVPRLLILRCPCGCGDDLIINLDKRSGPAWRLYSKSKSYTLFPSYWRDTECGSHFIVWNSKIFWCYSRTDYMDEDWEVSEQIEGIVLDALKESEFIHYIDLADEHGLVPWECLQACKQLSYKGLCEAKNEWPKEHFKKSTPPQLNRSFN